ncbi:MULTISPECIES: NAD(P)H-hydrate dehydratase [Halomonadaceae]|uniref:Bifunctional NAD(P)H-hydrate repair enzyme n=1 Tax=Vreelandella halophila TaxID=86177 RepID=A0A9X4YCL3_9GAMM|nr:MULTISPECIES: NAD(P)H-hydrate dehydratase [Halomonas]MYL25445.1 NAD(P)H-hydrate dehydratase [Halomonas utahensis]MYL75082.1 NAD(P)H-hydrate dehydratase [Halomonas sp. 22501_18_FS]
MPNQPLPLYTAEQVRNLDRAAIEDFGVDGFDLMKRAGKAAFRLARRRWPEARQLLVLCGGGNNGGDGYVVAGLAAQQGIACHCVAVSNPSKLSGTAASAFAFARESGVDVISFESLDEGQFGALLAESDLVVDTLLGTGLAGEVRAPYAGVIDQLNASPVPVLAVDIPSGLCSGTGRVLGTAVRAAATITFIGRKAGLYTGRARDCTGPVSFDDLSVDPAVHDAEPEPAAWLWSPEAALTHLPRRHPTTHKGECGRVLVVGGDEGMGGAGILAGEAALRCGAGLVFLATRGVHVPAALARRPEIQARAVEHGNDLDPLLERVDVVVVGPGLGSSAWGQQMLQRVAGFSGPVVADADALALMQQQGVPADAGQWILTPHPGEAARLLGASVPEVEADRYQALATLVEQQGATVILKGAGSLVGAPGRTPAVIEGGNPGMATAGMGDVLSGALGALLGQGLGPFGAAVTGAAWHAAAADHALEWTGSHGLLAGDLTEAFGVATAAVLPEVERD